MAKRKGNDRTTPKFAALKQKIGMNMENRQMNMNTLENHKMAGNGGAHPGLKRKRKY
jgi:hypothetical protein